MVAAAIANIAAITTADRRRVFHCDQCVSVAHQSMLVIMPFECPLTAFGHRSATARFEVSCFSLEGKPVVYVALGQRLPVSF